MTDVATDTPGSSKPEAGDASGSPPDFKMQLYREANMYARSIHDALYKHAAISFTFNAVLLAGLGLAMKSDIAPAYRHLVPHFVFALGAFGLVFNGGAFAAFNTLWPSWYRVHVLIRDHELRETDEKFNLQIALMGSKNAPKRGWTYWLTCTFYTLLFAFWFAVACTAFYLPLSP